MEDDVEIGRRNPLDLLELAGEVEFAPDFDHKRLRTLRAPGGAPVVHPPDTSEVRQGADGNRAGLCEDDPHEEEPC